MSRTTVTPFANGSCCRREDRPRAPEARFAPYTLIYTYIYIYIYIHIHIYIYIHIHMYGDITRRPASRRRPRAPAAGRGRLRTRSGS